MRGGRVVDDAGMNKIWLLKPLDMSKGSLWDPWFDKAFGFVVCAPDEKTARILAQAEHGEEANDETDDRNKIAVWTDLLPA